MRTTALVLVASLAAAAAACGGSRSKPDTTTVDTGGEVEEEPVDNVVPPDRMDEIKSYNMHIFVLRRPAGLLLGSDVVFVEPPLQ